MKELSIEKMEILKGGDTCSTTANVLGTIGFAVGVAALFTPVGAVATTLLVSQGFVFGGVGMLTGWMCGGGSSSDIEYKSNGN